MRLTTFKPFLILLFFFILLASCKKGERINVFSIEDDKQLGAQMNQHLKDSLGVRLLARDKYPISYQRLDAIRNYILNSGKIKYRTEFPWEVYIIREDSTLNAFATPGGYMYVYTGLIHYLDSEDHLAGVMGHEMAHADRRHSTNQMTKAYGLDFLLGLVLGKNNGAIGQVTGGLISLSFSREAEAEADEYSIQYLCQNPASYEADGAAGFFEKLLAKGQAGSTPAFLSTHPSPATRVEDIKKKATDLGCDNDAKNPSGYDQMKKELFP